MFNDWRNRISSTFKQPILYAFLINIIIRIPYFPHAQGDDAFVVAWMAQAIHDGFIDVWIINPLSIFGFYPYSFYPIGGPLILSIFFKIGLDVDSAFFSFSFLFMCISLVTSYYLGKLIFPNDKLYTFLFVVFYTTSPIFLRFSYWTASLRGPFLAILPLVLYFNLKLIKEFNRKNIMCLLGSIILLGLMHRLVILYPIYLLSLVCAILLIRYNYLEQKTLRFYLLSYFLIFIHGIIFFPIDPRKTSEFILGNDTLIGVAWNLTIDYVLRLGFIFLLALWGFVTQFSIDNSNEKEMIIHTFFIVLGGISLFFAPFSLYTSLIALPWFTYFGILGTKSLMKWQLKWVKWMIGILPTFFGLLYSVVIIILPIHLLGAALLAIASIIGIIKKPKKSHSKRIIQFYVILCFTIIIISRISVDGLINSADFPYNYTSEDEFIIADYLKIYNSKKEITLVYHYAVARRIQAICFQPTLFPANYPASVYYDWISIEEIQDKTVLDFSELITSGTLFAMNYSFPEKSYSDVLFFDLRENNRFEFINNLSIRFIVTDNIPSGYWFREYGKSKVPLLISIVEMGILRLETRYLRLYEISDNY